MSIGRIRRERIRWLPLLVCFISLGTLGLTVAYSFPHLFPDRPAPLQSDLQPHHQVGFYLTFLVPALAPSRAANLDADHAAALYDKLATSVLPCFGERERFIHIMRHAIALNGSFFNSQRMVWQYRHNAYQV